MTNAEKIEQVLSKVEKTILPNGKWHVKGNLSLCSKKLTSLKDLDVEIVDGYFDCSFNSITSLEGAPREVGGRFICDDKFKETEEYKDLMKTYETIKALNSL